MALTTFVNQSFANAEFAKDDVENVFDIDPAGETAKRRRSRSQLLGYQLFAALLSLSQSALKRGNGFLQGVAMPRAGHKRRFGGGEERIAEGAERRDQDIHPDAGAR